VGILEDFEMARDEIKKDPKNALLWEPILRKLEPGSITSFENAVKWSHEMADRFLRANMFAGETNAKAKIKSIIEHLTDHKKTKNHGRHISVTEAKTIFGDKVEELEKDQILQDLVLTVHHAAVITLQATPCYKMIENDAGLAFMRQIRMQVVSA
jgi:hypothetical protein